MSIKFEFFVAFCSVLLATVFLVVLTHYMNFGTAALAPMPVNPTWRSTCDAWVRNDCARTDWKWYQ